MAACGQGSARQGRASGGQWREAALLLAAPPLLVLAALANPDRLNPDAVAYLALARHWLEGRWELATSGYWGPLFSWLAAPLLALTGDPLLAGRAVMAGSAWLFLAGGLALLRVLGLPAAARLAGGLCLLGAGLGWSVQIMTPDLLVSGLLLLGVARALPRRGARPAPVTAGLLLGLAYYAKAVALPVGLLLLGFAAFWRVLAGDAAAEVRRGLLQGIAALLLVAAPWIGVLSLQYGHPSFGTTGMINLAIAGPAYVGTGERLAAQHPAFTSFHAPREGRVTAWEEPTELPYVSWSPLADAGAARHFARILRANAEATLATLRGFDALGLGLAALLLAPFAGAAGAVAWRAALLPVAMVGAVYLPSLSLGEPRYFLPVYPFLLGAALGLAAAMTQGMARAIGVALVAAAFLLPLRHDIAVALTSRANPALLAAREVAAAVRQAGVPGGIASVEELGFAAIFAAFLLDRPFLGTEAVLPARRRLEEIGAGVLLVAPGGAADRALAAEPGAVRLPLASGAVAAWRLR